MGNLYNTIASLCEKRNIKGAKLCDDIGISKGLLTDLKMGRRTGVSAKTAQKIASYFGVTVGFLLGEDESEEIKKEQTSEESLSDKVTERLREKLPLMTEADLLWLDQLIDLKIAERKNKNEKD